MNQRLNGKIDETVPYLIKLLAMPYGVRDAVFGDGKGVILYGEKSYRLFYDDAMGRGAFLAMCAAVVSLGAALALAFTGEVATTFAGKVGPEVFAAAAVLVFLLLPIKMKGEAVRLKGERLKASTFLTEEEKRHARKERWMSREGKEVLIKAEGTTYAVVNGGRAQSLLYWWLLLLGPQFLLFSAFDGDPEASAKNFVLRTVILLVEVAILLAYDYEAMRLIPVGRDIAEKSR